MLISSVLIGYLAACVTASAHLPQLWHVLKHRCAKDMSYAWLCIHITGASSSSFAHLASSEVSGSQQLCLRPGVVYCAEHLLGAEHAPP